MHYNCLIVDDEEELSKMTAEYFQMFDITTAYVNSAEECYKFFEDNTVDLLLLDINLGNGSGFDVCKKIREEYQLPILFISARQGDDDVLIALSIGGDDYIRKPYSMAILLAKVKVNLKRVEQLKTAGQDSVKDTDNDDINESENEKLVLEPSTMSIILNGERISLKAKEFALIECLYKYKNTIVTKDKLFEEVWGDSFFSDGTLNVHIRKLREKLEENPNDPQIIKTVWGTGYILEL
ncbi:MULTISPECIES: response regulator transcription factor [Eubacterium]|uniref:Stage 0 sporulation protein A homolog n=1 Tax=Eubacterium ruminantium TaxID=42322 RepID=A0A1T4MQK8_9FIRM|nr:MULTISPECIES: response regulator transcription factor [Eubacterium]MCR5367968.1 response regulator transcription factor [Eubacterium sp.]SCW49585.1 DNA-binding response regulator, OmpR family, contains REC and winged-helix (wHTH) domain [Eubacterium ruminantium]SDM60801.1 DNA-binding response regulator, OmpR family, contains REC and winged-helix (wHTH) domain [Eubacterium ruminantium]SJZ69074.1 DNA-binding response regulator, OmpR family, contains REC and winged-helix (wHTH) domain [Eubacter